MEKCAQYGSKWNKISQFFTNRADNSLRNRWQMLERRQRRERRIAGQVRTSFPIQELPMPPQPLGEAGAGLMTGLTSPRPIAPPPRQDWSEKRMEESLQRRLELAERVDSECNIFRPDEGDIWSDMHKPL
jgi:hypothetical protein